MFIGRSIQETAQLFDFYTTITTRRHGTFVDWGSGRGRMLRHAREHGFSRTIGFELHPALAAGTGALVRDIVEDPVSNASAIGDAPDGILHFVYDGGLYPRLLSQAIVASLGALSTPHQAVLVVTSMCEPYDPSAQFSMVEWRRELRAVGFSKRTQPTCDIRENKYSDATMTAALYYKK